MKKHRWLIFALVLLAGFSIALASIKGNGRQPRTPSVSISGAEVPGSVSDEVAQEAFLRILINDQNGNDKDWKMRSSYLRRAGFTDGQIENVRPVIENFKSNIAELDKQSLALSEENFANSSQSKKDQIAAVDRQ